VIKILYKFIKNKNEDGYLFYHVNENDFEHDKPREDLDVSGGELDDNKGDIGSEDEENNY